MPRLSELQKQNSRTSQLGNEGVEGREEILVADRRAHLRPAEMVDAKFWAALAAVRLGRETHDR